MKDFLKALIIVAVILGIVMVCFPNTHDTDPNIINQENEGIVVYNTVNFRSEPSTESDDTIICKLKLGDVVETISLKDGWWKVRHGDKEGYLVEDSVSIQWIMFDVSDFNWGSEYKSIDGFKAFVERAQKCSKFAGFYIQVQRTFRENKHWKELAGVLDEMGVPYGLYVYPAASTREDAKKEHDNFLKLIEGVTLENNVYPLMLDLENGHNQTEVLEYYKEIYGDDLIVYANASTMTRYGYHKMVKDYWVAHYGLEYGIPTSAYPNYKGAYKGLEPAIWQYTELGFKKLFGTSHLDVNVVSKEWMEKYTK